MRFTIHADGGARGNPGPSGAGAVVRNEQGKVVAEISEYLGRATNNVAEYTAMIRGFEALRDILGSRAGSAVVAVLMDSQLVVRHMRGEYKVKHPNLKPLAARAAELTLAFKSVSFAYIPRGRNRDADRLANEAMDRAR